MSIEIQKCPNHNCRSHTEGPKFTFIKKGFFQCKDSTDKIQRYKCKCCGIYFSTSTFSETYRQKKFGINKVISFLLYGALSLRKAARFLKVNRKTVAARLRFLGKLYRERHRIWLMEHGKTSMIHFDELETFEHTKCKPLSIAVAVCGRPYNIVGLSVASMPCKGRLARISRSKYGPREDHRKTGRRDVYEMMARISNKKTNIFTDANPSYRNEINHFLPGRELHQFVARRDTVAGTKKKLSKDFDPLFPVNHICADLRYSINRLVRRTWSTTKDPARLFDHLSIYMAHKNGYMVV